MLLTACNTAGLARLHKVATLKVATSASNDVAEPGTTPAMPTSKPIISSHTPAVSDTMINAEKTADSAASDVASAAPPASNGSMKPKLTPSKELVAIENENAHEADKAAADAAAAEPAEDLRPARLQELIESGEYNVTIHQKTKSGSVKTFLLTVFIIVLVGVVALYVLTDLKIIDLGIKLPYHIFKQ